MTAYEHRLPPRPTHSQRTPWTVMSELFDLQQRFAVHAVQNAGAFVQDYLQTLPWMSAPAPGQVIEYCQDVLQRQVLFWDVMRERGNRFIDHAAAGNPPVLAFDYEVVLDGETFPHPVNHALVRIVPQPGVAVDPKKRPIMVVDPRAGHGPGIGGFKADSQVGIALAAGHPVYFVIFKMHPHANQTLRDVAEAETKFLHWVAEHHPQAPKPCVLGNCQGGWAIVAVAAMNPELTGPLILSGAPLSYWAGQTGKNPMRYFGGLMGGSWLAYLLSDMNNGEFDGVNLVSNFESLDPANTLWGKYYNLYSKVDTEKNRFLDFERWWGGYIFLTSEEMRAILDNLFIGNKLSRGQIVVDRSMTLDLRKIKQPIIVFCSQGDNITPPQQALNWIADLYEDERAIKAAGQTIVYLIHEHSGHLGIFVSGSIVKREHQQIASTLEQIESLPPGLYEMSIIDGPKNANDAINYEVRLEERTIDELLGQGGSPQRDEAEFELVRVFSELNATCYELFVSPLVRKSSNAFTAEILRQTQSLRMQHWMISDVNPLLWPLKQLAETVKAMRVPAAQHNPLLKLEQANSKLIEYMFNSLRDTRDIGSEMLFYSIYGMMAATGIAHRLIKNAPGQHEAERLRNEALVHGITDTATEGDFVDATMRIMLLLIHARGYLSRSEIDVLHKTLSAHEEFSGLKPEDRRRKLNRQTVIVAYQPELALSTLPQLLPDAQQRTMVMQLLKNTESFDHSNPAVKAMWEKIEQVLNKPVLTEKKAPKQLSSR